MFPKITFLLFLSTMLLSCSYFKKDTENDLGKPIAKVNNHYLYKKNIKSILPDNYSKKDSVFLVRNFINSWAKKQLLLSKAQLNLSEELIDIDKLVQKYREDLLIDKYKSAVVQQNLDTAVSDSDITLFYEKNKETLKINEELLMLKFIYMDKDIVGRDIIEKLFKSDTEKDLDSLIQKELEFRSFYFNDSVWVKYSEVVKEVPLLEKKDIKSIPTKGKYLTKENENGVYLVKINKILERNSISPRDFVKPTIKQMILHSRKLQLLKKIEQTLLNDANKNKQYEIYE